MSVKEECGWEPPKIKMVQKKGILELSDNVSSFGYRNTNSYLRTINALILTVKNPVGKCQTFKSPLDKDLSYGTLGDIVGKYIDTDFQIDLSIVGEYELKFTIDYIYSRSPWRSAKEEYITRIAVGSEEEQIHNYTVSEVLNRTLDLTPTRTVSEKSKYQFDAAQLEEFSKEESPEFAFTGHTLFEAMLQISGYKGAFPEMRTDDSGNRIISFRPLWNGVWKTAADLPAPIDEITLSDINQYCTYLETEVQNLVGLNDSRKATLIEPYADGYKTTRSGAGSEISQDEEYLKVKKEASKLFEALEATLGDTQRKLLDDLYCTMLDLETEASKTHFVCGFNYGVRLISEAK